jgi:hypothetical protein
MFIITFILSLASSGELVFSITIVKPTDCIRTSVFVATTWQVGGCFRTPAEAFETAPCWGNADRSCSIASNTIRKNKQNKARRNNSFGQLVQKEKPELPDHSHERRCELLDSSQRYSHFHWLPRTPPCPLPFPPIPAFYSPAVLAPLCKVPINQVKRNGASSATSSLNFLPSRQRCVTYSSVLSHCEVSQDVRSYAGRTGRFIHVHYLGVGIAGSNPTRATIMPYIE